MENAPGFAEVMSAWVLDALWLPVLAGISLAYVAAFRHSRRSRFAHPGWRLALFAAGVGVLAAATVSPLAHYGRQVLWVDFTGFLLITMVAPPLLLLGAPLTLAFRASDRGWRRRLRRMYRSKPVAVVTFPIAAWLAFAVTTYLWQFTSLTDSAATNDAVRALQQVSLLTVGLLFWQPVVGADPARWRLAYPLRGLYVAVEMTHKGLFGGMFLSMNTAMHSGFASRAPAWAPDAMDDQRLAILILWIGGNIIFLVALIATALRWVAYEQRNQHRTDLRLKLQREAASKRRAALERVFTR